MIADNTRWMNCDAEWSEGMKINTSEAKSMWSVGMPVETCK